MKKTPEKCWQREEVSDTMWWLKVAVPIWGDFRLG